MNTTDMPHLLIVEDEWIVARFIEDIAEEHGLSCIGIASEWSEVESIIQEQTPQIAIVDINIEGEIDGIEVAKRLKNMFNIPMIFLTAHKDIGTIKEAAEASPLAYLIKPVTPEELAANLILACGVVLKEQKINESPSYTIGKRGIVHRNGEALRLGSHERKMLTVLLSNINSIVYHETIHHALWDDPDEINEASIRNAIFKLRKKLPDLNIEAAKNLGYKLIRKNL